MAPHARLDSTEPRDAIKPGLRERGIAPAPGTRLALFGISGIPYALASLRATP